MREDVYCEAVLKKSERLLECGFWARGKVRPRPWLDNFLLDERAIAAVLLDQFVYYSDALTDRLLRGAYSRLEATMGTSLASAVFTRVESENPAPTDSGNNICRRLRQVIGVSKDRILEPAVALATTDLTRPLVLVDDFLGSGQQLMSTWKRLYGNDSFERKHRTARFPAYYLTLIATDYGLNQIRPAVPTEVIATHVLGGEYSVRATVNHPLAPPLPDLPNRLHALLQKYSGSLQLDDYMRVQDFSLYGFHSIAVAFGFEHSIPDASVPLLWADGGAGWTPLVRRV